MNLNGNQRAIIGDRVAINVPSKDVDPEQLRTTIVPSSAFAELALLCGAGDCFTSHLRYSCWRSRLR
jgi:hypothetical protein